jgi:hypothetical protein
MGLIDHDHRITREQGVHEGLPDEEAIGKELDAGALRGDILKPNGIANLFANLAAKLLGNPNGYCSGSNTARLTKQATALALRSCLPAVS